MRGPATNLEALRAAREAEILAVNLRYDALELLVSTADGATAFYTATNLPPGISRRTFLAWCRSGAVVDAEPEGRGWRCSQPAWRAARASTKAPPPKLRLVERAPDPRELAQSTLREIRGGR